MTCRLVSSKNVSSKMACFKLICQPFVRQDEQITNVYQVTPQFLNFLFNIFQIIPSMIASL